MAANQNGLPHFLHPHLIAGIAVAFVGDRHVELILLVAEVRAVLAQIASHSGCPEIRSSHAPSDGGLATDRTDINHAVDENFVFIQQFADLADGNQALIEELSDRGLESRRHVTKLATDAGVRGGKTGTSELLAQVVNFFPLREGVEEDGHRTDVHGTNSHA